MDGGEILLCKEKEASHQLKKTQVTKTVFNTILNDFIYFGKTLPHYIFLIIRLQVGCGYD